MKITYIDEMTGETKFKRIQQSKASIKNYGYKIDRFKEIQARKQQNQNVSTSRHLFDNQVVEVGW